MTESHAAQTLREYLADRDMPCEQCGYNLRGAQDVFCPECGAVIPRPPAEAMQRARMDPAVLRLWCTDCDYTVTGVNAERCPECGGTALVRYSGDKPRMRGRLWFRPRGLPIPLWLNAVFGTLLSGSAVMIVLSEWARPGVGSRLEAAAVAAVLAFMPMGVAAGWMFWRATIRRWPAQRRQTAAGIAFVVGCFGWIYAILFLR